MDVKALTLAAALITLIPQVQAGSSTDGESYTNFGLDLMTPIFPIGGKLKLYKSKSDAVPVAEFNFGYQVITADGVVCIDGEWTIMLISRDA